MIERKMAYFGIFAFPGFILSFLVFASITPGYSHAVNAISELGIDGAPYSLAWNVIGFGLVGLLVLPFSWSLWAGLRPTSGATIIFVFVAISGIGWSSLGLFPAAPGFQTSLPTALHFIAVSVNYLAFLIAVFFFSIKLRNEPYWKSWVPFSLIMGIFGLASFFIPKTIPGALSQRLALIVYFLWLAGMGWALLRKPLQSTSKES
jgi:hypothetical membrane protein